MNAQQLKNSILQEAIEGRLVPQNPNDEPASVLLDKIRAEKKRLVKEGKLKKKDLVEIPITEDEIPFKIPESWEWVNLKFLFHFLQGIQIDKELQSETQKEGQVRFLRIIDYTQGTEPPRFIDDPGERYHVKSTDIVMLRYGTPGLPCRGLDGILANNLFRIIPYDEGRINSDFIFLFFKTLYFQSFCKSYGVALNAIKFSTIDNVLFPLPPLAEQKRIVAKIEELLPKVEEYGKAQEALDKLNEELPERLKKSILQEAIMGKLGTQDPSDAPASSLLNDIRAEKQKLVEEGVLKKKDLVETPVEDDEVPFNIPESWTWIRFGDLVFTSTGKTPARGEVVYWSSNDYPWVSISDMKQGEVVNSTKEFISKKAANDCFHNEISKKGTLIMSFKLTVGRTSILGMDAFHNEAIISIKTYADNDNYTRDYLAYILPIIANSGDSKDAIKGKTLNSKSIYNLLVPLPPLAEQHRIVQKIEKLYAEIDKLKV